MTEDETVPMSADTVEALEMIRDEIGKGLPDWLAQRIAEAIGTAIDARVADFVEYAADRVNQRNAPLTEALAPFLAASLSPTKD